MKYKLGLNGDKKKSTWVRIQFHGLNKKQKDNLFKAETYLAKAGLSFDRGFNFGNNCRDWEFDWSLTGAQVVLSRHYKKWWQFWK